MSGNDLRIRELESNPELLVVVHYACESWFTVKDRPVEITSVSFFEVQARRSVSFSQTDTTENQERSVLQRYFDYLRDRPDTRFVHWNMNKAEFGFGAIEKRWRWLTNSEPPYSPSPSRLYDLDALIGYRYGSTYADHPKLQTLARINGLSLRYFLSGKEEAEKYAAKQFGDINRSTEEKARILAALLERFLDGRLETKNSGPLMPFGGGRIDAARTVLEIGARLTDVSRQLMRRHDSRATLIVKDEYDLQDLYHSLLRLFFGDIREESWAPDYAGGATRIDFIIPEFRLALELKHARPTLKAKDLGEELIVDIAKYGKHPDVKILVCVVFDPQGLIPNPRGIERDLSGVRDKLVVWTKIIDR